MRASEIVKRLTDLISQHGDRAVAAFIDGDTLEVESIGDDWVLQMRQENPSDKEIPFEMDLS